jgi:glycosyltransferase involved in cell wall biosynthesis
MKDFKFIVVSKLPEFQNVNLQNITVFNGSWGDSNIDDVKLREIYSEAFLVLIPLKESSQPSGQSVALQAMSMGIPVLVSQTQGLWDKNHLINGENIFLIQPNTLSEWVNKIKVLKNNKTLLNTVSKNAEKTVRTHFNLSKFQNQLNQYIGE